MSSRDEQRDSYEAIRLMRQSSLMKLCPELALLLVPRTQAVAHSSEDLHEAMQEQMGSGCCLCDLSCRAPGLTQSANMFRNPRLLYNALDKISSEKKRPRKTWLHGRSTQRTVNPGLCYLSQCITLPCS